MVELLQTLATKLMVNPQIDGTVTMTSPQSAPAPRFCLIPNSLLPSALFFSEPARLVSVVRNLLSIAAEQHKEEASRIVSSLCEILKNPAVNQYREILVNAGKQDEYVSFPGAAVTVVSCREDPGCLSARYVVHVSVTKATSLNCGTAF